MPTRPSQFPPALFTNREATITQVRSEQAIIVTLERNLYAQRKKALATALEIKRQNQRLVTVERTGGDSSAANVGYEGHDDCVGIDSIRQASASTVDPFGHAETMDGGRAREIGRPLYRNISVEPPEYQGGPDWKVDDLAEASEIRQQIRASHGEWRIARKEVEEVETRLRILKVAINTKKNALRSIWLIPSEIWCMIFRECTVVEHEIPLRESLNVYMSILGTFLSRSRPYVIYGG